MGMEKVSGDPKIKEFSERKKARRRSRKVPAVQKLYDTCKQVFANCGPGVIPSSTDIERLKSVLDGMTELDVGLKPNMPYFKTKETVGLPRITYLHLCECDKFSIGIFCLPPSGVIPLHNHPGMTVFGKLLFGTMHIKSYDWVDDGPLMTTTNAVSSKADVIQPAGVRLAKVKVNSDFTAPCGTSILYPADGGNMHCFTAMTPCAVLDVLGPPYCDPEGRHCQYYLNFPFANFPVDGVSVPEEEWEGYAWLEEREKPEGLAVVGAPYTGPKIVEY